MRQGSREAKGYKRNFPPCKNSVAGNGWKNIMAKEEIMRLAVEVKFISMFYC
jgi:hypothetical protein